MRVLHLTTGVLVKHISLFSFSAQTHDRLDVVGLWEEIEAGERSDLVAAGQEFFKIACKCGGVAGDVGEM